MITTYILTAQMLLGWAVMPFSTEAGCTAALEALHPSVTWDATCETVEVAPGTIYAPPTSPIPAPRPTGKEI